MLNSGCGVECVWHEPIKGTCCATWCVLVFLNRSSLAGGNEAILFHFVMMHALTHLLYKLEQSFSWRCLQSYQLHPVLHEFSYSLNETCCLMCYNLFESFFCVELAHHEISLMHDTSCSSTCCVRARACVCVRERYKEIHTDCAYEHRHLSTAHLNEMEWTCCVAQFT